MPLRVNRILGRSTHRLAGSGRVAGLAPELRQLLDSRGPRTYSYPCAYCRHAENGGALAAPPLTAPGTMAIGAMIQPGTWAVLGYSDSGLYHAMGQAMQAYQPLERACSTCGST